MRKTRTINLSVYVTPDLDARIRREAARSGASLSVTMTNLLIKGLWVVHSERKEGRKAVPVEEQADKKEAEVSGD